MYFVLLINFLFMTESPPVFPIAERDEKFLAFEFRCKRGKSIRLNLACEGVGGPV